MAKAKESEPPSFEAALRRLEEIVEAMEEESVSLEGLVARYEEGIGLLRHCRSRLDEADRRIRILREDGETEALPSSSSTAGKDEA